MAESAGETARDGHIIGWHIVDLPDDDIEMRAGGRGGISHLKGARMQVDAETFLKGRARFWAADAQKRITAGLVGVCCCFTKPLSQSVDEIVAPVPYGQPRARAGGDEDEPVG